MYSLSCPFRSSILPLSLFSLNLKSSLVYVKKWIRYSCFWLTILSFCKEKVDSASLLLKSFSLSFSFLVKKVNSSVSFLASFDSDSYSRVTPKSCRRETTFSLSLKNISSVLILKSLSNLSERSELASLRLSNSLWRSSEGMNCLSLSINPSHLLVSYLILSYFVSFSRLSISIFFVVSPRRKVEALTGSRSVSPKPSILLDCMTLGFKKLPEDLTLCKLF